MGVRKNSTTPLEILTPQSQDPVGAVCNRTGFTDGLTADS